MGRGHSTTLWPIRKKVMDSLRPTGIYGLINEAMVRTRAAFRSGDLPEIRFAIYGQGRTGSRLLCDLLDSHPDITCDLEILAEKSLSPRGLIEAHARMARTRAHGFKFKYYQLTDRQGIDDVPAFLRDLHESGWRLIYLSRRDVVRHALSSVLREKTGVTHTFGAKGPAAPSAGASGYTKVRVDVEELRRWIAQKKEREALELEALGDLPHLHIVYEDGLVGHDAQARTTARVAEWLGLEPAPTRADVRPNTPRLLSDLVENLDELRQAFAGTDVAQFLG